MIPKLLATCAIALGFFAVIQIINVNYLQFIGKFAALERHWEGVQVCTSVFGLRCLVGP